MPARMVHFWWDPSFWFIDTLSQGQGREEASCLMPLRRTLTSLPRAPPSGPNHLPKAHLLILPHCRLRFQCMNFGWWWWEDTNIQPRTKPQVFPFLYSLQQRVSKCDLRPASGALLENLLRVANSWAPSQIFLLNQKLWGWGPAMDCNKPPGDSDAC